MVSYTIVIKFCYFLTNFIELPIDQQAVKQEFEKFCAYCLRFSEYLPIVFILGFFVSTIVSRWWDQFCSLPNPEQIAMKVVNFLPAKVIHTVYILTQQDLSLVHSYSLALVHLIPSRPVWAEMNVQFMKCPNRPMNQFKSVQQSRQQTLKVR